MRPSIKPLMFLCAGMGLLLGSAAPPEVAEAQAPPTAPTEPPLTRTVFQAVLAPEPLAAAPASRAEAAAPAVAATGTVRILVSLPQQRLWVFRGSQLVATSRVSTGKRGHATPTGTFPILQKRVEHYSSIYDNAPMPYMQRLTNYGIALHGGRVPGYPASHGCIRLPHAFARRLYRLTDFNSRVIVTRARPRSTAHALSLAS
ncbi:MAG: hypothetical protein QOC65_1385 [Sphingomonadales bacterium]|nr:hypothetical protein [Sphingomonadales bacterium]